MVEITPAGDPRRIALELTEDTRVARFKDLEIHLVTAGEAPAAMDEIGRIREREFRKVGAGRNVARDIDSFDTGWPWYSQLISWDPLERQIVAVYRAIHCSWAMRHGGLDALRTSRLFRFSEPFVREYLARSVELGRSVVNQEARRALQGLFSIWTGLGAMTREWPDVGYLFGNVSLYRSLPPDAVARITGYLFRHHRAEAGLVVGRIPYQAPRVDRHESPETTAAEALEAVQREAGRAGWGFPPILLSYLKAHPGMLAFDAAVDADFGDAVEVAIAVPINGLNPRTVLRFLDPYESTNPSRFVLPEAP